MATSSVSICSNALLLLGATPISDFNENTPSARLCSNMYPSVRNFILRAHPWNCATKRVVLAPAAGKPTFGWGNQFPLPGDVLRILSVGSERGWCDEYQVEGNRILANTSTLELRYIWRNEDESTWDATLVHLAEITMAAKIAYGITKSSSLRDSFAQQAEFELRRAKAIDGQENPPDELGGYPSLESRY